MVKKYVFIIFFLFLVGNQYSCYGQYHNQKKTCQTFKFIAHNAKIAILGTLIGHSCQVKRLPTKSEMLWIIGLSIFMTGVLCMYDIICASYFLKQRKGDYQKHKLETLKKCISKKINAAQI